VVGTGPVYVARYNGEGVLRIRNITFRRAGDLAATVMVIRSGEVDFSACRFTGGALSEDTSISGNGLVFLNDSAGVIKNCEVDNNVDTGVIVLERAKPELIDNDIHDNGGYGIYFLIDEDGGAAKRNNLQRNGLASAGRGTDIIVFGPFAPTLTFNSCSRENFPFRNWSDWSGIVLVSRGDLPAASRVGTNDCAVTWCSSPTGSLLNMECKSRR
jgi:hypothetical protein